ncbi:MAG: hypothetical protein BWX48_00018 [Verrucomicrobia bacterium ADurb.Bin006]|nr:MAG: hypothetical protein BWX48_00018 [Verrucomicrobia bacterium ADurb.Bin006]
MGRRRDPSALFVTPSGPSAPVHFQTARIGPCSHRRAQASHTCALAAPQEQYQWLKQAILNWRTVQRTLRKMQRLSREELFGSLPNPRRRKRLGKRVLGLV